MHSFSMQLDKAEVLTKMSPVSSFFGNRAQEAQVVGICASSLVISFAEVLDEQNVNRNG